MNLRVMREVGDAIVETSAFYRDNSYTILSSVLIIMLPLLTAFSANNLNSSLGGEFNQSLENFPVFLVLLFLFCLFIQFEKKIYRSSSNALKYLVLSSYIMAFSLLLNTFYISISHILFEYDVFQNEVIAAVVENSEFKKPIFIMLYYSPFIVISSIIIIESTRRKNTERFYYLCRSTIFWRSYLFCCFMAFYQIILYANYGILGIPSAAISTTN